MFIYGNKTLLRRPEQGDLSILYKWVNDPQLEIYGYGQGMFPNSKQKLQEDFIPKDPSGEPYAERFLILDRESKQAVGFSMLYEIDRVNQNCRTGTVVAREFWGQGYGTDARRALSHFCFHYLNMHRIFSSFLSWNEQSLRLHEKTGACVVGRLEKEAYVNGKYHDVLVTSMSRASFYQVVHGLDNYQLEGVQNK